MQKYIKKYKYQKGYAILFAVVIISAISVIISGLTSSTYKQLTLSSLAKSSQIAFYQADTALDCAFYADIIDSDEILATPNDGTWSCGNLNLKVVIIGDLLKSYTLSPLDELSQSNTDPCFSISFDKSMSGPNLKTKIKAKGYNICNKENSRAVEREIEVNY
jgi:hypothetical protein